MNLPELRLILDYNTFFKVEPPADRISLLADISRENLICEITALNYRLKPIGEIYTDISFDSQMKELVYFTKNQETFTKYARVVKEIKDKGITINIFNRQCCLFALEEISNSEEVVDLPNFQMTQASWDNLFKYLLAVNYEISQIKKEQDGAKSTFESLNPKFIPLNELGIETDPVITVYRGYKLIKYFHENSPFSKEIESYFQETYGIEYPKFIFLIMGMYMREHPHSSYNFFYHVLPNDEYFFDKLSERQNNVNEFYKLIGIRKFPFIKVKPSGYFLSDMSFLMEKTYYQFINDFWFDKIKLLKNEQGGAKFPIIEYRGEFGRFFESYLKELFMHAFANYEHSKLLLFDELKVKTKQSEIEIADFYLRYGNKILLGQVKSGSIYDVEKFGGDMEALYKNDRSKFFQNFGVDQLIGSILNMNDNIQKLDNKFPKGHTYYIYPCIIVNDRAFQTPFMADTFNKRFKELINNVKIKKVTIGPLSLIHVNDIERLQRYLHEMPSRIWDLLKYNGRSKRFIPPFYNTINHNLADRYNPEHVNELFYSLVRTYNPEGAK